MMVFEQGAVTFIVEPTNKTTGNVRIIYGATLHEAFARTNC